MNRITAMLNGVKKNPTIRYLRDRTSLLAKRQRGGLLVEAVVTVSLLTVVGTTVLSGLSTTHISGAQTERQSVAENVARNQMASVFSAAYQNNGDSYLAVATPGGYTVTATTEEVDSLNPDPDMQKVVVEVRFDGGEVFTLESIKVRP